MTRILLLGGTQEASRLAALLAEAGRDALFSYAGRTEKPAPQPLPIRVGGFGGVAGLVEFLRAERITHIVDATHPFAAGMSRNALLAAEQTGIPLLALERPGWTPGAGDRWQRVADIAQAVAALPDEPGRIFLAIGRQNLDSFAARPEHAYLLRLVDPPAGVPLAGAEMVIARPPFSRADDRALMEKHRITLLVAKDAGGVVGRAKLDAARDLGLPVILIERPVLPPRLRVETPEQAMEWLALHGASALRGA
ncbi:MAG: cobalt-precorrin-6A reductase [Proteobacteria bacterium]|nr:cobalt-precorrin-6A reductase [Pseudomonadota bacterium]